MSATPVDWALTRDLSAPKKLLLVALAWIADDTGVTFKGQKTIAARLEKDGRWVRQHLPELAAEGFISRYRRHRMNGSRTSDLIVLNLPRSSPLDLAAYDGILGELEPGDRPTGENPPQALAAGFGQPSGENPPGHTNQQGNQPAPTARRARDEVPDDFPDELRPHAREVYRVLDAIARDCGAKAISPKGLAYVLMARPRRPLVKTAYDLASSGRRPRDVVATYRNWLDREEDLAAVERLPGEGPAALPGNVTPLRGGRRDAEAERRARQARRAEIARGGQA